MLRVILIIATTVTLNYCQLLLAESEEAKLGLDPWVKVTCTDENKDKCDNKISNKTCEAAIPNVPEDCEDPENKQFVDLCLNRCLMCCNDPCYSCSDKKDSAVDCSKLTKADCDSTSEAMHTIVVTYCPLTCGKCNETTGCKDSNPSECQTFKDMNLCNDFRFHEQMVKECPLTCNFCDEYNQLYSTPSAGGSPGGAPASVGQSTAAGSGTTVPGGAATTAPGAATTSGQCVDIGTDCQTYKNLCNDPTYHDLLLQRCPLTCGFCTANPATSTCADNSTACAVWAQQGFCSSTGWSQDDKKKYCAKTCNLC